MTSSERSDAVTGDVASAERTVRPTVVTAARAALVAYLLVPLVLTLGPTPFEDLQTFNAVLERVAGALTGGRVDVSLREAEALANVAMFVPLGFLLPLALPRLLLSVLLGACAGGSLGIELGQYLFLPDRVPAFMDVVMNTAGAAAGIVLGGDARRLASR